MGIPEIVNVTSQTSLSCEPQLFMDTVRLRTRQLDDSSAESTKLVKDAMVASHRREDDYWTLQNQSGPGLLPYFSSTLNTTYTGYPGEISRHYFVDGPL